MSASSWPYDDAMRARIRSTDPRDVALVQGVMDSASHLFIAPFMQIDALHAAMLHLQPDTTMSPLSLVFCAQDLRGEQYCRDNPQAARFRDRHVQELRDSFARLVASGVPAADIVFVIRNGKEGEVYDGANMGMLVIGTLEEAVLSCVSESYLRLRADTVTAFGAFAVDGRTEQAIYNHLDREYFEQDREEYTAWRARRQA